MSDRPRRAVEFKVWIQADSIQDLAREFRHLEYQLSAGQLSTNAISAGYNTSYRVLLYDVDESITHEVWEQMLRDYLDSFAREPGESEADDDAD